MSDFFRGLQKKRNYQADVRSTAHCSAFNCQLKTIYAIVRTPDAAGRSDCSDAGLLKGESMLDLIVWALNIVWGD
jgi:hypothetical protein